MSSTFLFPTSLCKFPSAQFAYFLLIWINSVEIYFYLLYIFVAFAKGIFYSTIFPNSLLYFYWSIFWVIVIYSTTITEIIIWLILLDFLGI